LYKLPVAAGFSLRFFKKRRLKPAATNLANNLAANLIYLESLV